MRNGNIGNINRVSEQNTEYFNVKACGRHSNHCVSNGYEPVTESSKY